MDGDAMRRLALLTTLVMAGSGIWVTTASAIPKRFLFQAGPPPAGVASVDWQQARCALNPNNNAPVALGTVRTDVFRGPDPRRRYYQRVKIQAQRLAGFGPQSQSWKNTLESATTYNWGVFLGRNATFAKSGKRTGNFATGAELRFKATVSLWQSRRGPDFVEWKYDTFSPTFNCDELAAG